MLNDGIHKAIISEELWNQVHELDWDNESTVESVLLMRRAKR